jgi:hypothetical protein
MKDRIAPSYRPVARLMDLQEVRQTRAPETRLREGRSGQSEVCAVMRLTLHQADLANSSTRRPLFSVKVNLFQSDNLGSRPGPSLERYKRHA